MERKIGERFKYNGGVFEVLKEEHGCDGCCFNEGYCICSASIRGECTRGNRNDYQGVIFKKITNMEQKSVKIDIPEGYEIDRENSTFEEIKFKPIKKQITYKDVTSKLFSNYSYWITTRGGIDTGLAPSSKEELNNCTSYKQAEKLLAINKLMNVAKYLNDGWAPDWCNGEVKCALYIDEKGIIGVTYTHYVNFSNVYFKYEDTARKAVEILGEDTIRLALSTDY